MSAPPARARQEEASRRPALPLRPDGRPPVVFMGIPMAINVRDILRTDAFPTIRASGAEIHLFTPDANVEEFTREFGGEGVTIHPLVAPPPGPFDRVDGWVLRLHVALLSLRCDTARIMVSETLRASLPARLVRGALALLGRRGQDALLSALRRLTRTSAPELYDDVFARHQPDLVVGTRALTMSGPRTESSARYLDRHLLLSAARRGIATMVLVSSWDNLTTSGFFAVDVDRITVWNRIMKEQAVEIHGLRPEQVTVTGAPQHDLFARDEGFRPRAEFLTDLDLDPDRPVIVYATGTEGTIPDEPRLVEALADGMGAIPGVEPQLLVRLHQLDRMERYGSLQGRKDVVLDQAGRPPAGSYHDRDFDRAALEHLADTLRHADVVLNAASSISIDAAAVGSPVVCVDMDAHPDTPYHRSVRRFYDFTHQKPVVTSGGVVRARSTAEVLAAIGRYLADPTADAEGRSRLVAEQCHTLDGQAGRRVGEAVLAELGRSVGGDAE